MATRRKRRKRDVDKNYPRRQFIAKLRRLADSLEQGTRFRIQIAGERVSIPPTATITLEHERGGSDEEVEFQMKWFVSD
ncbi:MAG: amphi-Trp domain-containing protein [Planctomycetota bacterium]